MDRIKIKGAREHNLKNIDVEIPRDRLVVITGVSGSGKSSLAFDTIYAEGERRYLESLSTYARQFLGKMKKPDVDHVDGLSPSISIQQQSIHGNPRSIVGTVTEIYDYFRLLWGRIGTPTCPKCGRELSAASVDEIVESVYKMPDRTKFLILSPQVKGKRGTHQDLLERIQEDGFVRVRVDGQVRSLDEEIVLKKNNKHTIEIVVDRLVLDTKHRMRLVDSVETSLRHGNGKVIIVSVETNEEKPYSEHYYCPIHEISFEEVEPRMFSFNAPYGACPHCSGLGALMEFDPDLIVDREKSIRGGALRTHPPTQNYWMSYLEALSKEHGFLLTVPFLELSEEAKELILYGDEGSLEIDYESKRFKGSASVRYEGVIPNLKRRYFETHSFEMRQWFERYMINVECPVCNGARLKPESLAVKIDGKNIMEVTQMSVAQSKDFFQKLPEKLSENQMVIAKRVLKEVLKRLQFILDVGLDYLTLDRKVNTISGGEFQRIRLATQVGSGLMGVLYVLDEPTIGLHSRDTDRLITSLEKLRDTGNTVIVVEHDEEMIRRADWIVDIGPGAGIYGGKVVANGRIESIEANPNSLTGLYLSGKKVVEIPKERREGSGKFIEVRGAREHNLKNINVRIPLGKFVVVTGVSGSGKSTFVDDILYKSLQQKINRSRVYPGKHDEIVGVENIDKIIDIDQSPIGRTPRSNPATYTGIFTYIRDLFANLPEAKMRGYKAGRFSFNVKGGRCEACQGDGSVRVEMHFLPDVYLTCEVCGGKRYNQETLQIRYKGKSISDLLDMSIDEAVDFFEKIPSLKRKLEILQDVGLGYVKLGQPATTLSGGEAQRVKLAKELSKIGTGQTLYILDEPTVGLHFEDVKRLIQVLNRLVDKGNTVLVIEHNMDIIKIADYLIDLGPEGGEGGGQMVFEGTPEEILHQTNSYTGIYLKSYLDQMKG